MPRTLIPEIQAHGTRSPVAVFGDDIESDMIAGDVVNEHYMDNGPRTVLVVRNDDAGAQDVTVTSVDDDLGRSEDVVVNVPAGGNAILGPFPNEGFQQPAGVLAEDGNVFVVAASANLKLVCVRV